MKYLLVTLAVGAALWVCRPRDRDKFSGFVEIEPRPWRWLSICRTGPRWRDVRVLNWRWRRPMFSQSVWRNYLIVGPVTVGWPRKGS